MRQNQRILRGDAFDPHLLGTVVLNLFRSRADLKSRTFFFGISSILP